MSQDYSKILKNREWEEQIPLLQELQQNINNELKNLKDESHHLQKEKEIILSEYREEKQQQEIITNEKNVLLKLKEKTNNRLYNIFLLSLTLVTIISFFSIIIGGFYLCAPIFKFLSIFNISNSTLAVLGTLGLILFDIGLITIECKYILPKLFDKPFDRIPKYINNLKKFDKIKDLEQQEIEINKKLNKKTLQLEIIQNKYRECQKQIKFKEEYLEFLNTDIKTKILTLTSYNNQTIHSDNKYSEEEKGHSLSKKLIPQNNKN